MDAFTSLLLSVIFFAIAMYVLFFAIRAGVEAGIRRALPEEQLRPQPEQPPLSP